MPASHIAIYNDLRGSNNSLIYREASSNLALGEGMEAILRGALIGRWWGPRDRAWVPTVRCNWRCVFLGRRMECLPDSSVAPSTCIDQGSVPAEGAGAGMLEEFHAADCVVRRSTRNCWGTVLPWSLTVTWWPTSRPLLPTPSEPHFAARACSPSRSTMYTLMELPRCVATLPRPRASPRPWAPGPRDNRKRGHGRSGCGWRVCGVDCQPAGDSAADAVSHPELRRSRPRLSDCGRDAIGNSARTSRVEHELHAQGQATAVIARGLSGNPVGPRFPAAWSRRSELAGAGVRRREQRPASSAAFFHHNRPLRGLPHQARLTLGSRQRSSNGFVDAITEAAKGVPAARTAVARAMAPHPLAPLAPGLAEHS